MIETNFGGIRSYQDLHLIQQKVEVQPAEPKLNIVDIPGADGSKDLSELPAGRVCYEDRKIKWTFALYPGDDWHTRCGKVSGALNGRACHITLHDDTAHYFDGRIAVKSYKKDKMLRQITMEAICRPFRWKQAETVVRTSLTSYYTPIYLHNDGQPVVPKVQLSEGEAQLVYNGVTYAISGGVAHLADFTVATGDSTAQVRAIRGFGTLTISYREREL